MSLDFGQNLQTVSYRTDGVPISTSTQLFEICPISLAFDNEAALISSNPFLRTERACYGSIHRSHVGIIPVESWLTRYLKVAYILS